MTNEDPPINPATDGVPDPLLASRVTTTEAAILTTAVTQLRAAVNRRTATFLVILVVDVVLTAAITVLGYRSEHFLTCQAQQNVEFRHAASTERAAQRALFDVVLDRASSPADRYKASQDYYVGLVAAEQQRTMVGSC